MINNKYFITLVIGFFLLVCVFFINKNEQKENLYIHEKFINSNNTYSLLDLFHNNKIDNKKNITLLDKLNLKKNNSDKKYSVVYDELKKKYYLTKDPNLKDLKGISILMYAVHDKDYKFISELLENGANPNAIGNEGFTALTFAAMNDDLKTIKLLINNGADINLKNSRAPIFYSVAKDNIEILEYLVDNGANLEIKSPYDGKTPLHEAFINSNIKKVEYLLEKGASLHATDAKGYGVTMMASVSGDLEKIKLVDSILSNLLIKDEYENNVLMLASYYGGKEVINYLVKEKGIDVNEVNQYGNTALLDAARFLNEDALKALIQNGANVNAKTNIVHSTVLSDFISLRASKTGEHDEIEEENIIAETLIQNGARINEQNDNGRTPLHVAVIVKKDNLVKVLLNKGADLEVKDKFGNTPLDIAKLNSDKSIISLFSKNN